MFFCLYRWHDINAMEKVGSTMSYFCFQSIIVPLTMVVQLSQLPRYTRSQGYTGRLESAGLQASVRIASIQWNATVVGQGCRMGVLEWRGLMNTGRHKLIARFRQ